jgi:hypothetical protein
VREIESLGWNYRLHVRSISSEASIKRPSCYHGRVTRSGAAVRHGTKNTLFVQYCSSNRMRLRLTRRARNIEYALDRHSEFLTFPRS